MQQIPEVKYVGTKLSMLCMPSKFIISNVGTGSRFNSAYWLFLAFNNKLSFYSVSRKIEGANLPLPNFAALPTAQHSYQRNNYIDFSIQIEQGLLRPSIDIVIMLYVYMNVSIWVLLVLDLCSD